ncbi:MAG: PTS sugar transporter subunit IIC [Bacilli bacterium]|nr:PTS sugar transporter subunit IIC [Bacilli bacterium]
MEEVKRSVKDYLKLLKEKAMTTTNGMAIGLFGTLIIGTIINLFAKIPGAGFISTWALAIQGLMGAGIGLGVALSLKKSGIATVAITAAGFVGNFAFIWVTSGWMPTAELYNVFQIGDPLSCYISSILAVVAITYINQKKTPVDLILIPLVGLVAAILYSAFLAEWVHFVTLFIGWLIEVSTNAVPFIMCILISVLTGMALTAPISSVAICVAISIGNTPLAAAAALIGCSTQMVGFAVQTARDNKWGSVLAVGLGTSMLQFKNIIKNPIIWLPTIITSAILGPFAMLMPLENAQYYIDNGLTSTLSVGAGMGTSGLVGPLNFLAATDYNWIIILEIVGLCILAPIVLVFFLDLLLRKVNLIKQGDLSLKSDI